MRKLNCGPFSIIIVMDDDDDDDDDGHCTPDRSKDGCTLLVHSSTRCCNMEGDIVCVMEANVSSIRGSIFRAVMTSNGRKGGIGLGNGRRDWCRRSDPN